VLRTERLHKRDKAEERKQKKWHSFNSCEL
jgi:hypothetical protein